MAKRWFWWVGTATLVTLALVTMATPGWRLGRERAAARKEGLALTLAELGPQPPVPTPLNAAPLIYAARIGWRRAGDPWMRSLPILQQTARVIDGKDSPSDRSAVMAWSHREAKNIAEWRAASKKRQIDFDERGSAQWNTYSPLLLNDRYAISTLVAIAAVGVDSRENLLAAARLAGLMRKQGEAHVAAKGSLLGEECLLVAQRLGLTREVSEALGPPVEVRSALRPLLPQLLSILERQRFHGDVRRQGMMAWIDRILRPGGTAEISAISQWRAIWKALPANAHDFEGAARITDAKLPVLAELTRVQYTSAVLPGHTFTLSGTGTDVGECLRAIGHFETLRANLVK